MLTHTSLSPFRLGGTLPQVPRLRMRQLVPQHKRRLNSESRVPISNPFYKWKDFSENPSAKVPGGWHGGSPNCLGGRRYTKTWEATGKTYTRRPSIICFFSVEHLDCTYRNTVPSVKDKSREPLQMKSGSRSCLPAPKAVALTPSNWTTRFNRLRGNPW